MTLSGAEQNSMFVPPRESMATDVETSEMIPVRGVSVATNEDRVDELKRPVGMAAEKFGLFEISIVYRAHSAQEDGRVPLSMVLTMLSENNPNLEQREGGDPESLVFPK